MFLMMLLLLMMMIYIKAINMMTMVIMMMMVVMKMMAVKMMMREMVLQTPCRTWSRCWRSSIWRRSGPPWRSRGGCTRGSWSRYGNSSRPRRHSSTTSAATASTWPSPRTPPTASHGCGPRTGGTPPNQTHGHMELSK